MFGLAGLSCRLYGQSVKLSRLQCTEERFSLVGSADMLIKVDFVNIGWPAMMATSPKQGQQIKRESFGTDLQVNKFVIQTKCFFCTITPSLSQ